MESLKQSKRVGSFMLTTMGNNESVHMTKVKRVGSRVQKYTGGGHGKKADLLEGY